MNKVLRGHNVSSEICSCQALHDTSALLEPRAENAVRVLKHAILQTDHDELAAFEPSLDKSPDVLRMGQIQCGVNLIKNVHGCRFEL